jgi:threonine synthase
MIGYMTPLVKLEAISREVGIDVYGKLEYTNPTGSHKDRESLKVLDDASSKGFKDVAIASTGNAAVSLAAHSLIYGMRCHVFVSESISEEKAGLISSFDGELHKVKGGLKEACGECVKFIGLHGAYDSNPGRCIRKIEGDSAIGEEIAAQLEAGPSHVFVPTNNGTLLSGIWAGLKGSHTKPRMVAATAPLTTMADSISGFNRLDAEALGVALKESNGVILSACDEEIIQATLSLMGEGIFCEPASATSLAALRRMKADGVDLRGPAVLLITGTSLKYPSRIKAVVSRLRCEGGHLHPS